MKNFNRRDFLKTSALASTSLMLPQMLTAFQRFSLANTAKRLVVIQFSGGNDGLNMVVPFNHDVYYQMRPTIGIAKNNVLKLTDEIGLNPAMQGLKTLYDEGYVSIVNNVGYPQPNRSHFRSMDIWHTASASDEYLYTGWLGRYMDEQCNNASCAYTAIEVDDTLSLAMQGGARQGIAMQNPKRLYKSVASPFHKELAKVEHDHEHENIGYLHKTLAETISSAEYMFEQSKKYKSAVTYPNTQLGKKLKTIAELMIAGVDTRVFYVELDGFDTHVKQLNQHAKLLGDFSEATAAFTKDLKANNLFNETLIMNFSEFGRRVKQNGSGGTDHGTASNMIMIGGGLKNAGVYNNAPNLSNLKDGDLQFEIDFRQVYATVLKNWMNIDDKGVLGKGFELLDFV